MKIGFVVNQMPKEEINYTTTGLALKAKEMGHDVYYISVGDLIYTQDERMGAHARRVPDMDYHSSNETFLTKVKTVEKIVIDSKELDVLFLRNDPSVDFENRAWAQNAGVVFGQLAQKQGVIVLNNPAILANALNKMYFQYFPKSVRPEAIITRNIEDIIAFYNEFDKKIILKPLQGSGGKNVFLINEDQKNLNQIVDTIAKDGFIVAQEYLSEAQHGDIRLFLLEGEPIVIDKKVAAIHRVQAPNDIRSNIHQGGTVKLPIITDEIYEIIEAVKPKLKQDGMFLTGLDIVGNKLMEINIFSPGGIGSASKMNHVDFYEPVIQAIERKLAAKNKEVV